MNLDQILIIVRALAILTIFVFMTFTKPALDTYVGKEKVDEYLGYIKVAIRCAEQIFTPEQWAEKKDYVYNYAVNKAKEFGLELSAQDIDILVEGFVNEIKKG